MTKRPERSVHPPPRSLFRTLFCGLVPLLCASGHAAAQLSLASAVTLALRNSPRVRMAEDDVRHAEAVLAESHDVYIPRVSASGGLGDAYGITLTVPTIFTVGAQSLLFSFSQRNYIRAARLEIEAATRNLEEIQSQVVEDTAVTYISLDHARQLGEALAEEQVHARALGSIVEQRNGVGLESRQEVRFAARTALQIQLQALQNEDEAANLRQHLTELVGLDLHQLTTLPESIPDTNPDNTPDRRPDSRPESRPTSRALGLAPATPADPPYLLSAAANARARLERAFGDAKFAWRPQVSFEAQYGRISPIVDVSSYYNIQGNYNTLSGGLVIQFPFFDAGRKARARQSAADAAHALHDLDRLRGLQREDDLRAHHALAELQIRLELAALEQSIALDQLKSLLIDLQNGGFAGPPRNPKEEQNARIHERQTYIDLLDAQLQLRRTRISLLRQTGELTAWAISPSMRRSQPVPSAP